MDSWVLVALAVVFSLACIAWGVHITYSELRLLAIKPWPRKKEAQEMGPAQARAKKRRKRSATKKKKG